MSAVNASLPRSGSLFAMGPARRVIPHGAERRTTSDSPAVVVHIGAEPANEAGLYGPRAVVVSRSDEATRERPAEDAYEPEKTAEDDVANHEEDQTGTTPRGADGEPLSETELEQLRDMKARDREVRAHEQAHKATGGAHAGAIRYEYDHGPDGRRYAVGGEVPIDVSEIEGDPAKTIQKMQTVRRAALAPAQPSAQDRAVASEAAALERKARAELAEQKAEARATWTGEQPSPDEPAPEDVRE